MVSFLRPARPPQDLDMPQTDPRLLATLSLALNTGLALTACTPVTPTSIVDPDTDTDSEVDSDSTTTAMDFNLAQICAADSVLEYVTLASPVDSLHYRSTGYFGSDGEHDESWSSGTACATATDSAACLGELDITWPESSGWGYCGEGCTDYGLVTTAGDDVELHDSTAEVNALFGSIDSPADALFLARTQDYTPDCSSLVFTPQSTWQMTASFLVSDCEWTEEVRQVEVSMTGETTVIEVLDVISDGACAGRLPDGIAAVGTVCGDAVARHLAHLAWLEGAAVIAFQRLAVDLERLGAPRELVNSALAAADDEVDHASRMGALAATYGVSVPQVEVAPPAERSLFDVALENAVEGCVRETYGVVDALFRSKQAPNAEIRDLFAHIAADETRHSALSWDIAEWAKQHLCEAEVGAIKTATEAAHQELLSQLQNDRPDAVQKQLGAPSANVAVAMADTLRVQLAA